MGFLRHREAQGGVCGGTEVVGGIPCPQALRTCPWLHVGAYSSTSQVPKFPGSLNLKKAFRGSSPDMTGGRAPPWLRHSHVTLISISETLSPSLVRRRSRNCARGARCVRIRQTEAVVLLGGTLWFMHGHWAALPLLRATKGGSPAPCLAASGSGAAPWAPSYDLS